jgi:uncharacterized protein YyaL (SSP411 family)
MTWEAAMAELANLLGRESSPYLLQHAANPVHWRPWGEAALAEAKARDCPILLSIGYAACHWCHVMAHESFEDPETAALMNRYFVNIKVDREERPDIDHLYMSALQAMGEPGGWPLTIFLTPDGAPFWGGTYFPPEPRWGRPAFRQVLQAIADAWQRDRAALEKNARALRTALRQLSVAQQGPMPDEAALQSVFRRLLQATDPEQGGLRGAPKFPNPPIFRLLWQCAIRWHHHEAAAAVFRLLDKVSQGGIYDHLGGGYARYAVDTEWRVPHFEKMLYDNAQILELLAFAHAAKPKRLYAERAAETVSWALREMRVFAADGSAAFASSQDADSEGEEGRFYVWTEQEIDALLGPAAPEFKTAYDVRAEGNWEAGKNVLRRVTPAGDSAYEQRLAAARAVLFAARSKRVPPGRDDKVLADWNGLMIAALARSAWVFGEPTWLAAAEDAFGFILTHLGTADGRVAHAWRSGRVSAAGLLEDQASMARAGLALYEATGKKQYLTAVLGLIAATERWFAAPNGAFFTTASDASDLPLGAEIRLLSAADGVTPSGNGVMAETFARLYHLTGEEQFRTKAESILSAFGGAVESFAGACTLLTAADLLRNATVAVIAGDPAHPVAEDMLRLARSAPDPTVCTLHLAHSADLAPTHPAFGKAVPKEGALAYVCRGQSCSLPVASPEDLRGLLGAAQLDSETA